MTPNERLVLKEIERNGKRASIAHLAKSTQLSTSYTKFLCERLARRKYIFFPEPGICEIKKYSSSPNDQERILNCSKCSGVLMKVLHAPQILDSEIVLETKCPHCTALCKILIYKEQTFEILN